MACADLMEALRRADTEARKLGKSIAIYGRRGCFYVEALKHRTGLELEVVNP